MAKKAEPESFLARYRKHNADGLKSLLYGAAVVLVGDVISLVGFILTMDPLLFIPFGAGILASVPVFAGFGRAERKREAMIASLYEPLGIEHQGGLKSDNAPGAILSEFVTELSDGRRGEVRVVSNGDEADPSVIFSEISTGKIIEGSNPQKELAS